MHDQEEFEQVSYAAERPFDEEVHACTFKDCDFTDSDLSDVALIDCVFESCNLSMAKLAGARLQDVSFENCKLVGVDFSQSSDFGFSVRFSSCNLDYASFWGKTMKATELSACSLKEANFVETDLAEAVLAKCDLKGAAFSGTNLESADLRGARNFSIDPELNRVHHAKVSRAALEGLLHKYELEVE